MAIKNENGEDMTLDQILEDAGYQADFDKKIAKAIEKANATREAEWAKQKEAEFASREEEIRKNIQAEIEAKQKEAEENAKLSEAEKYKKELDKVNQKMIGYENEITIMRREKKAKEYIKSKEYDPDILDFVKIDTVPDDKLEAKIDEVNEKFTASVSKALNEKLKEDPDKMLGDKGGNKGPQFEFHFQPIKGGK